MMKCQKCPKPATLHITEIISEDQVEELHLCEECAHKYLYEPQPKQGSAKPSVASHGEESDEPAVLNHECSVCGIKFVDFRNTGRLGCPHDYQEFRDELTRLLENIHGETRHCGKTPKRLPQNKQKQAELVQLRKQLLQAVNREAYEEAARLRDRIRQVEES
jgi:protein arginine kinase activator